MTGSRPYFDAAARQLDAAGIAPGSLPANLTDRKSVV